MRESDIVSKIRKFLDTLPSTFSWKEHGGMYGTAGIPDIICCHEGKFYAFEVKTPQGKITALQQSVIRKIKDSGGIAEVVRSVDDVKAVLRQQGGLV